MAPMFDHCMYFNTTALARQLEKLWTDAFAPFDLTPPQGFMLRAALDRPGMSLTELAQALVIAKSTATRAVDQLEGKGLLRRELCAEDGRGITLQPTADALRLHGALNRASGEVTRRLKQVLGEPAFEQTVAQVKRVRAAIG